MYNIFLFLYCWAIIFYFRSNSVRAAKMLADKIAIVELKMIANKQVHDINKHVCLSDYFDDNNFIFNPNYFDKWTSNQFLSFVIKKRINEDKDIIFNNKDIYKDVL